MDKDGVTRMNLKRVTKFIKLMLVMLTITSIGLIGCGKTSDEEISKSSVDTTIEEKTSSDEETKNLPIATITVEGYGEIIAELYPETAPNTVNNFISLANSGFYNNLTFHRVVNNFMIQGGDPNADGTGGPGYSIAGEFAENGFGTNNLKHTAGVLSMARSNNPDSAGSQFFIMDGTSESLDGKYAAFGKVISGMDVVNAISEVKTEKNSANENSKPKEEIVIKSITVDTKGIEYKEPEKMNN